MAKNGHIVKIGTVVEVHIPTESMEMIFVPHFTCADAALDIFSIQQMKTVVIALADPLNSFTYMALVLPNSSWLTVHQTGSEG